MRASPSRLVLFALDGGDQPLHRVRLVLQARGLELRLLQNNPPPAPRADEEHVLLLTLADRGRLSPALAQCTMAYPVLWFTAQYCPETAAGLALSGQILLPVDAPAGLILRTLYCIASRQSGADYLAQSYGLSPQETRLVRCMMRGLTTEESAEIIGCKVQTVPSYWNRIFRKTGVRTQRDLLLLYIRALRSHAEAAEQLGAAQ